MEQKTCRKCQSQFWVAPEDKKLYGKLGVPSPALCPHCRHRDRIKLRPPRRLFDRECSKCHTPAQSPFEKTRPERVCCEKCYLETLY